MGVLGIDVPQLGLLVVRHQCPATRLKWTAKIPFWRPSGCKPRRLPDFPSVTGGNGHDPFETDENVVRRLSQVPADTGQTDTSLRHLPQTCRLAPDQIYCTKIADQFSIAGEKRS